MGPGDLSDVMGWRARATGAAVAAAAVPYTFQRTFMTRSNLDQALATGLGFTLIQSVTSAIQEAIQSGALLASRAEAEPGDAAITRWSRTAIGFDVASVVGGIAVQRVLDQRPGEDLARATGRTIGQVVSITGAVGAVIGGVQEAMGFSRGRKASATLAAVTGAIAAQREWDRRRAESVLDDQAIEASQISGVTSLAMGGGVAVAASLISALENGIANGVTRNVTRILPGSEAWWRPLGHVASLALLAAAGRAATHRVFHLIEGKQFAVEPAIDVPPLQAEVSGGPTSLVPFPSLSKMGRRFVWTVRSPAVIESVTGEPAQAMPIRVFVGLESAASEQERVDLALAELERTGAFDRSWLMITTPTGTGYANYAAAGALEMLSLGDCANVVMQYGARPSPISLDRVSEGRKQVRMLVDAIHDRLADVAVEDRPKVVMFGESLGAWSSQDAFIDEGTQGLVDAGIDYAIWIGTPMESKWKEQVLRDDRPDSDRSLIGVFNDIGEWHALSDEERDRIRYVMITHYNDGVAKFGASLAVQAPDWLGDPDTRPASVPRSQRWIPVTTFIQALIDTKNAARVVPGLFDADGHDYRGDLVPFIDALLDFGATQERRTAIVASLEQEEARRTKWIAERGAVGESMATALLDKVRSQDPAAFEAAFSAVQQDFVNEDDQTSS